MDLLKSRFVTPYTDVRIVRERAGFFIVLLPVVFYSARLKRELTVPALYETDFASIPRFLKDRIDVNGKHREAAIIHDYGCTNGDDWGLTQKQVDKVFNEAMTALGVPWWQRTVMYNGVQMFQRVQCWRSGQSYG